MMFIKVFLLLLSLFWYVVKPTAEINNAIVTPYMLLFLALVRTNQSQ